MQEAIQKLKDLVDQSDNIVFFGGAGVSTESGIPDFRSTDGLYHQQWKYPPEVILSHTFYESNPEDFSASTGPSFWRPMPSPMPPTISWPSGSGRESCGQW